MRVRVRAIGFWLSCGLLAACGGGGGGDSASQPAPATPPPVTYYSADATVPVSGPDVPGVAPFDQAMSASMKQWNVPGATLFISRNGKLILARGYGYSDFENKEPMRAEALFRINSITKVLTSIAMLRLRDRGQLDLDQTFLSVLTQYRVGAGGDARLVNITLRDLLRHSGGWDRTTAGDIPLAAEQLDRISKALNVPRPISSDAVIRYTMLQPLQFAPGTREEYSNLGFLILGRVIERVSGQSYESYVREQVLAPLGVHAMSIGRGHASDRGPLEVKYYAAAGEQLRASDFPGEGSVASPYSYDLARVDSVGGWIASGADLTRVLAALDPALQPGFLSADSRAQMFAPPPYAVGNAWYGLGIGVGPNERYNHNGALPGSSSFLEHLAGGYGVAILVNSRYPGTAIPASDAVARVEQLLANGFEGSAVDLYAQFPSPVLPASGP